MSLITQIRNKTFSLIGDPHLGKTFNTGVPLERRGEREAEVFEQFKQELLVECDVSVCMGDIFDKLYVPNSIVLATADAYREAALANPNRQYHIVEGNHDVTRDADKVSSYTILRHLLAGIPNIQVSSWLKQPWDGWMFMDDPAGAWMFFVLPYNPFRTAEEVAQELVDFCKNSMREDIKVEAVFGHWEIHSFGGADANLCPKEILWEITDRIYTGHVHTAETVVKNGKSLTGTGSMQPYAHGEGDMYLTLHLDELQVMTAEETAQLRDRCVRLILPPGTALPVLDCRQLTGMPERGLGGELIETKLEDFTIDTLLKEQMTALQVNPEHQTKVLAKFHELQQEKVLKDA